jgi:hypothetical protein
MTDKSRISIWWRAKNPRTSRFDSLVNVGWIADSFDLKPQQVRDIVRGRMSRKSHPFPKAVDKPERHMTAGSNVTALANLLRIPGRPIPLWWESEVRQWFQAKTEAEKKA